MDIGLMLKQSWEVVWRHKFLWLFGFFAGLNGLLFELIRLFFGAQLSSQFSSLLDWLQQPQPAPLPYDFDFTQAELGQYFFWFVVLLFVQFIGFWVIATIAEASIIHTVTHLDHDEPVGLGTSLRAGLRLLGRFLAIDAAVFFPWFLIALTMMLIMIVVVLAIGYLGVNNAELNQVLTVLIVAGLCFVPLLLLLIPVAWFSFIYRTLAFRDAVILNHSIRQSIKHTWVIVRANFGTAVLVTLLMMAIQSIGNWIVSLLSLPVFAGLAYLGGDTVLGQMMGVVLTLITAVISGIIYAYIATAWTITYKYWVENGQQLTGNSQ